MKAIVIDQIEAQGRRRYTTYRYPQYRFDYRDSTYITAGRGAHTKGFAIGDSVSIIFREDDPGDAIVYDFFRYWVSLPHLLIVVLLALFFFFACINIADYIDFRKDPTYDD